MPLFSSRSSFSRSFRIPLFSLVLVAASFPVQAQEGAESFVQAVWPIFEARCIDCHAGDRPKGKLRLDTPEAIAQGGASGPALVAGKPDDSLIFQRISLPADHIDIMPAKGDPLTPDQVEIIRKWIEGGADFGDWKGPDAVPAAAPSEGAVAPAEAAVQTAAATTPAEARPDPLLERAKGVSPPPEDALTALQELGGLAATISQDIALVRVDLHLLGDRITDEQLGLLAPLTDHVTWLNIAGTKVTDNGVAQLAPLKNLTRLNLEKTGIGDEALAHLSGLEHLEYLNLYGTHVSDAGLTHLASLKNLKRLYLWQTKVTPAGAERLKQALPEVEVNLGTELAAASPEAGAATPAVEPAFDDGSCCATAKAEGKACDHPCCVEAAAAGTVCAKCNPKAAAASAEGAAPAAEPSGEDPKQAELAARFSPNSCCAVAHQEGKTCDHPCCKEARDAGEVCVKCNPTAAQEAKAADAHFVRFNRDIRPILAENCLACHGMDGNARKAGLRLDDRESALASKAVVPGDPEASELLYRVARAAPEDAMPPASTGKRLTPEQVALLERWIAEGAPYEKHWSYIPPQRPAVPAVDESLSNPIDAFIRARLEKEGLEPSPEADRVTLIRRLSFDLTGLPPSPDDVDAFVNDGDPRAYEKLVDRLLASPHFGERMAVDWLDLVRYADTNGYHGDEYRSVWPYRDYVVRAFNENKPFDQFTIEQLAGDLLPDATTEQKVASAYNRLNQLTAEGGAQPAEYVAKYAADRVRTAATAWLGATLGCAECHDHKFDPFSQKDFFRFAAFFADVEEKAVYRAGDKWEPILPLPTEEQAQELARLEARATELKQTLENPPMDLAADRERWEADQRAAFVAQDNDWLSLVPAEAVGVNGTELTVQDDRSILSYGPNPDKEIYEVRFRSSQRNVTALRLETFTHATFPNQGLSRGNGNFVLTGFEIEVCADDGACTPVAIAAAAADFAQDQFPIEGVLDDRPDTGWAVAGHEKPANHEALFVFKEPVPGGPNTLWAVRLKHESGHARHAIGHFRLGLTTAEAPMLPARARLPEPVYSALLVDKDQRSEEQEEVVARYYRDVAPALQPIRDELAQTETQLTKLRDEIPYTLYTVSVEPRTVRVLPRGNWMDESGEIVEPGVPEFLPPLGVDGRRATRLDLARWLVSDDNPLTARVYVNRLWEQFFGTGLSKVLEDLGNRGEWPTHPDLLDWLAVEFVDSGWDVKHMVRMIVTSATYRQSSRPTAETVERDPYNRLLARQTRFRLPAEFIRDNALAIAGLLSPKLGGPSVKPYQPDGYWADCNTFTGPLIYDTSTGEDQYRRGLYTYWKRSFLHPSLLAFDAPTREECTADRTPSNTPLQALVLLNDPTYVEAARIFAEHIVREGGDSTTARIVWAYRRALGRAPTDAEIPVLERLCAEHYKQYKANPKEADKLLETGQAPVPDDLDHAELAAWTSVARTLLNLNETVSRL